MSNAKILSSRQGVIYTGGGCPPFSRVSSSLTDHRLVVAADSGYHHAVAHNVAVDVLIGDFDSLGDVDIPASVQSVPFSSHKDKTDTELAIDYCLDAGCDSLLLVGGGGGTIDHLCAIIWLFEGCHHVNRWISDTATIDYTNDHWQRTDCQAGEIISVLPIGSGPWRLHSNGLRWPLDTVRWQRENTGIRNEATTPTVSVVVKSGALLIIHRFS